MRPDIEYQLSDSEGREARIPLFLDPDHHGLVIREDFEPPDWALLDHCQCSHCPLSTEEHRYCPIARNLAAVLPEQDLGESFHAVTLRVETGQRGYHNDTTLQRALSSLFGLVCALSDCPHTRFLRPMALFHLPVSTETETLARTAAFFLLQRFLRNRDGDPVAMDMEGLEQAYRDLGELNRCFVGRFRATGGSDAPVNAMILLHVLAKDVNWELHEQLDALAGLFHNATGDGPAPASGA